VRVVVGFGRGVVEGVVERVNVSVVGLREGVLEGEMSSEEGWVGEGEGVGLQKKRGKERGEG